MAIRRRYIFNDGRVTLYGAWHLIPRLRRGGERTIIIFRRHLRPQRLRTFHVRLAYRYVYLHAGPVSRLVIIIHEANRYH